MRSTVLLDDELVREAKEITGITKTSPMINEVLMDFIRRENLLRLVEAKGSDNALSMPPRRRA